MDPSSSSFDQAMLGWMYLIISSLFSAIIYLPLKFYNIEDGLFYQFIVALGMWSSSFIVDTYIKFPKFYPLPMLGGFLWSFANLNTPVMVNSLGIGLSSFISNAVCLLVGWGNARFGWFKIKPEIPSSIWLNNISVFVFIVAIFLVFFVDTQTSMNPVEKQPLIIRIAHTDSPSYGSTSSTVALVQEPDNSTSTTSSENSIFSNVTKRNKWLIGIASSVISGAAFGFSTTPILYVIDNYPDSSQNLSDYMFSLSTGVLLSSLAYFIIYCAYMKDRLKCDGQIFFPSLLTGFMWTVSNWSFFLATNIMTQSITFPITNCVPSLITLVISIILKEIRGFKNLTLTLVIGILTIIGSILCGLSK